MVLNCGYGHKYGRITMWKIAGKRTRKWPQLLLRCDCGCGPQFETMVTVNPNMTFFVRKGAFIFFHIIISVCC